MKKLIKAISIGTDVYMMIETAPAVYDKIEKEIDVLQARIRELADDDDDVRRFKYYFDKAERKIRKLLNKKFGRGN